MTRKQARSPITAEENGQVVSVSRHLLTIDQTALVLNVSRSTVYALIREQGLPFTKIGNARRVILESLDWWISQQERSNDPHLHASLHHQQTEQRQAPIETREKLTKRGTARKGR